MSDEDLKKPITWQMLKDFVNKIPDEHLQKTAVILFEDESIAMELLEPFEMHEDIYIYGNVRKFKRSATNRQRQRLGV